MGSVPSRATYKNNFEPSSKKRGSRRSEPALSDVSHVHVCSSVELTMWIRACADAK